MGGLGSALVLVPMVGCRTWMHPSTAARGTTAHQRATLIAIADTFLPSGPGSPGATEADAITTLLDPAFPVAGYVDELVADLDDWCFVGHGGRAFVALGPTERERALEERMGLHGRWQRSWYVAVYEGVLALTKLAFFGGLTRSIGTTYVGFPGPAAGYAPASAAGVYAAPDGGAIEVTGAGRVASVRITVATVDRLQLIAPDGSAHPIGDGPLDGLAVAIGPIAAAGTWRLDGARAWWLSLRTDLDDRGGR